MSSASATAGSSSPSRMAIRLDSAMSMATASPCATRCPLATNAPTCASPRPNSASVYLDPEYRRQSWALHGQPSAADLARSTVQARRALGEHAHDHGVRFIDNHDVFRFLRDGEPLGRLHAALGMCVLYTGIPMIYYGTEQGFRQATQRLDRECSADRAAPRIREDTFADGAFVSASSAGEQFDSTDPTCRWTRQLLAVRRAVPPLRRDRQTQRWADPSGPGVSPFSRHTAAQEALVVLNTAADARSARGPVGALLLTAGWLVNAVDADYWESVIDGAVQVHLARHRMRVLLPNAVDAGDALTPGLALPGSLRALVVRDVVPTVDDGRFPAKAVVGEPLPMGATAWWHGAAAPQVCARFTGPDGTEQLAELRPQAGVDRYVGEVESSVAGWWTLRIEVCVLGTNHWTVGAVRPVFADPPRGAASAWYSLFPRSTGGRDADGRLRHGTLRAAAEWLPHIAALGFDVVHLTPIHPIGATRRKGLDGGPVAGPDDPGCPRAVGAAADGHDAVHPELGSIDDVRASVVARTHGIDVALELVGHCSPDHPWLVEHPNWFTDRITGEAIAERGCTDIVALDVDADSRGIAAEVRRIVQFWIAVGIRTLRVDNPQTKPAAFWHPLIWDVKSRHPDVVFLGEAFTRPTIQHGLSALGFSQTLTHFMWRGSAAELVTFGDQLQQVTDILRSNLFPANHDVLPVGLRGAGPSAFAIRAALAANLAASWEIPSGYELGENEPAEQGQGWRHAEKFELRAREVAALTYDALLPRTIRGMNAARRAHPELRRVRGLRFHHVDNLRLLAYNRWDAVTSTGLLCVVTLDPDAAASRRGQPQRSAAARRRIDHRCRRGCQQRCSPSQFRPRAARRRTVATNEDGAAR